MSAAPAENAAWGAEGEAAAAPEPDAPPRPALATNEEWLASAAAEDFTGTIVADEDLPGTQAYADAHPEAGPGLAKTVGVARGSAVERARAELRARLAEAREADREKAAAERAREARLRALEVRIENVVAGDYARAGLGAVALEGGGGGVYFEGDACADPWQWVLTPEALDRFGLDAVRNPAAWSREDDKHAGGRLAVWDTRAPSVREHLSRIERMHDDPCDAYLATEERLRRAGFAVRWGEPGDDALLLAFQPGRICRVDEKAIGYHVGAPVRLDAPVEQQEHDAACRPLRRYVRGKRKLVELVTASPPRGEKWRDAGPKTCAVSWAPGMAAVAGRAVSLDEMTAQLLEEAFARRWTEGQVTDAKGRGIWLWRRAKDAVEEKWRGTRQAGEKYIEELRAKGKIEEKEHFERPNGDGWERVDRVMWRRPRISLWRVALDTGALRAAQGKPAYGGLSPEAPAYQRVSGLARLVHASRVEPKGKRGASGPAAKLVAAVAAEAKARIDAAIAKVLET